MINNRLLTAFAGGQLLRLYCHWRCRSVELYTGLSVRMDYYIFLSTFHDCNELM